LIIKCPLENEKPAAQNGSSCGEPVMNGCVSGCEK